MTWRTGKQRELIDTLWNVNAKFVMIVGTYAIELIDTLWNVNTAPP